MPKTFRLVCWSTVKWTSGKIKRPLLQMTTLILVHCVGQSKAKWCQLSSVLRILTIVIERLSHKNAANTTTFFFPAALPSFSLHTNGNEIGFVLVAVAGVGDANKLPCFKVPVKIVCRGYLRLVSGQRDHQFQWGRQNAVCSSPGISWSNFFACQDLVFWRPKS